MKARSGGPGCGSEFEIRLPLAQPRDAVSRDPDNASARPIRRRRILVVDDNVDAARSLAECLRLSGHEVLVASDGEQAVSEAARMRPEVVILDIGMPVMDGYEVVRRLRQLPGARSAVIVALTGFAQERDAELALEAGFDRHFPKPLDFCRLTALLEHEV